MILSLTLTVIMLLSGGFAVPASDPSQPAASGTNTSETPPPAETDARVHIVDIG